MFVGYHPLSMKYASSSFPSSHYTPQIPFMTENSLSFKPIVLPLVHEYRLNRKTLGIVSCMKSLTFYMIIYRYQ